MAGPIITRSTKMNNDPMNPDLDYEAPESPPEPPPTTHIAVTSGSFTDFARAVEARAFHLLGDLDLEPEYLSKFAEQFAYRMDGILQKYRAGQLEHGGKLTDRDLAHERSQEIDDLMVYDLVDRSVVAKTISVTV